ncbi:MAG: flavodoxin [Treponema sp.]|nr:flavodoxin [Treponema sp.]
MKKLILSLLIGGIVTAGVFAAPSTPSTPSTGSGTAGTTGSAGSTGSVAVVYFSATGTTERMAKDAAKAMGADIFEIQPVQKYSDADLNWHDKKSRSSIECNDPKSRPAIANKIDIAKYDTVILCYPIWWAYAPKIVYTFVESQNWNGKKLVTLCTSGGSKLGRSGSDLAKFAKGADFKGGKDFTRGSGADIKKYVERMLK